MVKYDSNCIVKFKLKRNEIFKEDDYEKDFVTFVICIVNDVIICSFIYCPRRADL